MGRVERRMYKRRQSRKRAMGIILGAVLVIAGAAVLIEKTQNGFSMEMLLPQSTKQPAAGEDAMETREVTLAEETWYAIQTGVFSTEEAARQKADAYAERGAPGTVVQEGEKWRVFIACYPTEAEATAVRTRLEQNQKVDTYLYAWKCPELRLRLTGKASQLDAVEAGFTLLQSTAAALRDTATELDAAQLTTHEVKTAVQSLDEQITLWEKTLRDCFGRKLPDLALQLMEITSGWDGRYAAIREAEGATALSAALKAQGMGLFDELSAWRRAFAAQ